VTIAAIAALAPALAPNDGAGRLRGDLLAALASVVNWRFLATGRSYAGLFAAPSPVLHFWSLAIEAQFYVVFPLVVVAVALLAHGRRFRPTLTVVLAVVAAAGVALSVRAGTDAAYYSTLARAPELLAGAFLALALRGRHAEALRPRLRWGWLASPLLLVAWSRTGVGWVGLGRGGFALHALASAAVVAAAATDTGRVAAALGARPLAWLGRISYAAYLFHWPIFVWLTPDRAGGLHGLPLVAVHVALTLVLAAASSRFVERPIRQRRPAWPSPATGLLAAGAAAAAAVLIVVAVPASTGGGDGGTFRTGVAAAGVDLSRPSPPGLPRIAVFGDSTALRTAFGLPVWGIQTREIAFVGDRTVLGCGLSQVGTINATGTPQTIRAECRDWPERWRRQVHDLRVDAALVQVGPWDTADHRLPNDKTWHHLGEPAYDAIVEDQIRAAVDALSSSGAKVLWLTSPLVEMERTVVPRPTRAAPSSDPARMTRLNELVAEVAAERPDVMRIIDVAGHVATLDPSVRPDGVHISEAASHPLAEWLGPQILAALGDGPAPG
jgi:peptidoglycan/LPS O-acetylase OafA/YrhL